MEITALLARNAAAARLRRPHPLRPKTPLTQAALAEQMADLGLPWTQSTVALVETGRRQLSAIELVALSAVTETPMAELLDPGEWREVTVGEGTWPAGWLRRVADGTVGGLDDLPVGECPALPPGRQAQLDAALRAARALPAIGDAFATFAARWGLERSDMRVKDITAIITAADPSVTEAAFRVRRMLRGHRYASTIQANDVAAVAWVLWGRPYSDEHAARSGQRKRRGQSSRSLQAVRGHVTREMDQEIANHVKSVLGKEEQSS